MLPDTRTYNIALAAAAKRGTDEGLRAASGNFRQHAKPIVEAILRLVSPRRTWLPSIP